MDDNTYSGKQSVTNPFSQTTKQYTASNYRHDRTSGHFLDQSQSNQQTDGMNRYGQSSASQANQLQDTSYTYTLQQPMQQSAPPTAAFGVVNQYQDTSSEYSDYGEEEEGETESSGIDEGEDYGEEDDS